MVLVNQQEIHPVTVASGLAAYPDGQTVEKALQETTSSVYWIPGLAVARELGNTRVLNTVLLGALSALLPVSGDVWEGVLGERVPSHLLDLNLRAFHQGRAHLEEHPTAKEGP
jgi:indolepyruvate ferredoxin oxidoreductase beta subunit